jgi:hypothetical protein
MKRLPIADAFIALVERGMTEAEAAEEITAKISTGALPINPHRLYDKQYGPSWITNPIIDFRAGTIAMPLQSAPSGLPSWNQLYPQLTPVRFDVCQDQFDSLWPAKVAPASAAKRGVKQKYDWDTAEPAIRKMLDERGDPTKPENASADWNSKSSIAAALVDCLTSHDGGEAPDMETARPYARKILKKWQQDQDG